MIHRVRAPLASTIAFALVAACGSAADSSSSPPTSENAPRADAGPSVSPIPLPGPSSPKPTPPRKQGVAFVHGTGDNGGEWAFSCAGTGEDFHCGSNAGVAYWQQVTIDSERMREDGTLRPWVAVGCALSSYTPWPNPKPVKPKDGPPEPGSSECVANEISRFLAGPDGVVGTEDDIDDLAIVTHSGGGNVVRYILQQQTARPSFHRIYKATRGVAAIAAPVLGTYLADRVFGFGVLSIGNDLFNVGYDDDGTDFIQTTKMAVFNADPAKFVDLSKNVNGVPFYVGGGVYPDKDGDKDKVACGGEIETKALNFVHGTYFDEDDPATARNRCSDGFVSCLSAMALANGDLSRVMFGEVDGMTVGVTRFRAHNQTRRSCNGVDLDVRATVNRIFGSAPTAGASSALPASREPFVPLAQRFAGARTASAALEAATSPFAPRGTITDARATVGDDGVVLTVATRTKGAARLGLRATLVSESTNESFIVTGTQESADADPDGDTVIATLHFDATAELHRASRAIHERLVVRDVVLVSHDDASTLDVRSRVELSAGDR